MAIGAAIGSVVGGLASASAAKKASRAQQDSAAAQLALQERMYDETTERFAPYLGAGGNALNAYQFELGLGSRPKGYEGFSATPGYEFQLEQGLGAVNALAGARGGLQSGRTMQDLQRTGQGLANQEYGNHLNRLAGMTDMGMGAAGNQAAAGNAFAAQASNSIGAAGNAQAAGAIGVGNAIGGAINNGIGAWQYQQMLNQNRTA